MRLNPFYTSLLAGLLLAGLLGLAWVGLSPQGRLIPAADFSLKIISPNADGVEDLARITYRLREPATVSIYFINDHGQRFEFREQQPRDAGEHTLLFSGIVNGYTLPGDQVNATILRRVLPNGNYQWHLEAATATDKDEVSGSLTVEKAETSLPDLKNFTASPTVFTPNQDGLDDRATINVWLTKEVPPSNLRVLLIDKNNVEFPIGEGGSDILPGRAGLHTYDYDGGIDLGVNPPADGQYVVRAEAEDRLGQKTRIETTLTIANGGLPRAEIYQGEVKFSSATVVIGHTLYFTVTVENYGSAPIRTFGPWSGTLYQQAENSNTLGFFEQDGAWRIGLDCDSCIRDYPWRWGLGTAETLTTITQNGQMYYYLMPNQRAVITGGVILTEVIEARNPQYFWAGLIHEAVGISEVNNRVDPKQITIVKP